MYLNIALAKPRFTLKLSTTIASAIDRIYFMHWLKRLNSRCPKIDLCETPVQRF